MSGCPRALRSLLGKGPTGFLVFTALSAVQRLLSVIVLPLVASALPIEEYGQISIVTAATVLFSTVLSFGVESWVFRAHFAYEKRSSEEYLAVIGLALRTVGPVVGLVAGAIVWIAARTGIGDERFVSALAVALVGAGFMAPVGPFGQARLRAQQRFSPFAVLVLSFVAVSAAAKLVLVGALGWGLIGWVVGDLAASVTAYFVSWLLVPLPTEPQRDRVRPALSEALKFGAPLLPHILLFQALNQADRFVLAGTVSDADIGRYAIAQQAMWIFAVVLMEFTRAIMPSYARHSVGVRANALRHLVGQQLTMAPAVATAAVVTAPVAVGVLLPSSYAADLSLYLWLAIAVVFVGLYSIPTNLLVLVAGRSQQVWVGTSLALGVNLTLVWALAPTLGVLAAAMASALGYITLTAVMSIVELRRGALLRRCFPEWRGLWAPAGAFLSFALAMISLTLATPLRMAVGIAAVAMAGAFVIDARRQARFGTSADFPTPP